MKQQHYHHSAYAIALSIALLAFLYATDIVIFTDPIIIDSLITTSA